MAQTPKKQLPDTTLFELLLTPTDSYSQDAVAFVGFLKKNKITDLGLGLGEYAKWLDCEHDGKRYSASTYNKRLTGAKSRIRYLFEKTKDSMDLAKRFALERALDEVRYKKLNTRAVNGEKTLTPAEIRRLVASCEDTTIALMVEFLAYTGVRVSEMLNILLSDIKSRRDRVDMRVIGKGGKERIVWVDKPLLERIRNHFSGSKWLFEHSGKQYSRVAVTNRIKYWGVKVLGREITAHTLRHYAEYRIMPS